MEPITHRKKMRNSKTQIKTTKRQNKHHNGAGTAKDSGGKQSRRLYILTIIYYECYSDFTQTKTLGANMELMQ
jgi:hypothetical protein